MSIEGGGGGVGLAREEMLKIDYKHISLVLSTELIM